MKIFLHYSWDSEAHKDWVLKLANRLVSDGVDLFFDRFDLKPGSNNLHFMEQVQNANKVVLVMSDGYKTRSDDRKGGIGYEYQIIASQLANELNNSGRIIPVLRGKNKSSSIPALLSSYLYIDMSNDKYFENVYLELLRAIFNESEIIKPTLGKRPDFSKIATSSKDSRQKVIDIFSLGWTRQKVKKVLGLPQYSDGLQEKYWSHGLEVYYNRHWNRVDGVLAKEAESGIAYDGEVNGIKIGDTFAEVRSKIGNPINWGIPDEHLSIALYLINGNYLNIALWRSVPTDAPIGIRQGTVMGISLSTEHSILSCTPIVMIAIEEIRQGKRPTLLEHRRGKLNYDPKATFWNEHYEISPVQLGIYGGYFIQVLFTLSNRLILFWLYDLAWDKFVIRALSDNGTLKEE